MMMMIMMKEKKRKIEEKRKGRYVDNITSAIAKICKDINRKKKKEKKKIKKKRRRRGRSRKIYPEENAFYTEKKRKEAQYVAPS